MPAPVITPLEKRYSLIWYRRGKRNSIMYRELAVRLGAETRAIRNAVERLVTVHHMPICSSYDAKQAGYFWPVSQEEVLGQLRILIEGEE
ncbi:MAG: hypothetical protein ABFD97_12810 [Syntrophobacter sp.]